MPSTRVDFPVPSGPTTAMTIPLISRCETVAAPGTRSSRHVPKAHLERVKLREEIDDKIEQGTRRIASAHNRYFQDSVGPPPCPTEHHSFGWRDRRVRSRKAVDHGGDLKFGHWWLAPSISKTQLEFQRPTTKSHGFDSHK